MNHSVFKIAKKEKVDFAWIVLVESVIGSWKSIGFLHFLAISSKTLFA